MEAQHLAEQARRMRIDIVRMIAEAGSGHPGGSLSCADILTALYFGGVMDHRPDDPAWDGRDRFILAKGHAAPALYAALALAGYFPEDELDDAAQAGQRACRAIPIPTRSPASRCPPDRSARASPSPPAPPRASSSTASPRRVFALLGDGECQEGQVWEAAMFAAHRKLDNLIAIVDRNGLQIDGAHRARCAIPATSPRSSQAFGWDAREVDGHDIAALVDGARPGEGRPRRQARTRSSPAPSRARACRSWKTRPDGTARPPTPSSSPRRSPSWRCDGGRRPAVVKLASAEEQQVKTRHARRIRRDARRARGRGAAGRGGRRRPFGIHHHQEVRAGRSRLRGAAVQLRHRRAEHDRRRGRPGASRATSPSPARSPCSARGAPTTRSATPCATASSTSRSRPTHAGVSVGPRRRQPPDARGRRRSCAGFPNMRVLVPADYAAARAAIRLAAADARPGVRAHGPCLGSRGVRRRASSWSSAAPTCCARAATSPSSPAASRSTQALMAADKLAAEGDRGRGHRRVQRQAARRGHDRSRRSRKTGLRRGRRGAQRARRARLGGRRDARAPPPGAGRVRRRAATGSASRASSRSCSAYFHLDADAIVEAVKKVVAPDRPSDRHLRSSQYIAI